LKSFALGGFKESLPSNIPAESTFYELVKGQIQSALSDSWEILEPKVGPYLVKTRDIVEKNVIKRCEALLQKIKTTLKVEIDESKEKFYLLGLMWAMLAVGGYLLATIVEKVFPTATKKTKKKKD